MSVNNRESLKFGPNSVTGDVKAVTFKDGDFHIMYIPSLNLSSYGSTEEEAVIMMKDAVIPDFCMSLLRKNRAFVMRELIMLGWNRSRIFEKQLSKSSYIDKEGILREFELAEDTVMTEKEIEVSC